MANIIDDLETQGKKLGLRNNAGVSLERSVKLLRAAEKEGIDPVLWYRAAEEISILSKLVYDLEEYEQTRVWGSETEPTAADEAGLAAVGEMVATIGRVRSHIDRKYGELTAK